MESPHNTNPTILKQKINEYAEKNGGSDAGGSGGVTSWNDLEDKPFGSEITIGDKVFDGVVTEKSEGGYQSIEFTRSTYICADKPYKVVCNGVEQIKYLEMEYYLGVVSAVIRLNDNAYIQFEDWGTVSEGVWVETADVVYRADNLGDFNIQLYEAGESVKKIDPKYLPDISGGVNSWNDLQDKPFDVTTELVDVVAYQNVESKDSEGECHQLVTLLKQILKDGKYRVYLNGKEYTCPARLANIMDGTKYIIGNPKYFSGRFDGAYVENEDTGEPFALYAAPDWATHNMIWSSDLGKTITFRVVEELEVVKKLDAKFVEGAVFTVNVTETYNEEYGFNEYAADKSVVEICNAYNSGNHVKAVVSNGDCEDRILHLTCCMQFESSVSFYFVGDVNGTKLTLRAEGSDYGEDRWEAEETASVFPGFEYIPNATGETVTVEEFNNLLNALRNCQILPWSE